MITQIAERTVPLATALGQMIRVGYLVDCTDSVGRELDEALISWHLGSRRGVELAVGVHFDDAGRHIRLTEGSDLQITLNHLSNLNYKLILSRKGVVIGYKIVTCLGLSKVQFQGQVCKLIQSILRGAA